MFARLFVAVLALVVASSSFAAGIYRYVDAKGRVTFTDQRLNDGYVPMVKTWKGWKEIRPPANLREGIMEYLPLVELSASRHKLSPDLIKAVIHAESHYNPVAVSSAGAVGLMQLMPDTATRYGVNNRQDPRQNIEGGTKYLKDLMAMFENDTELVLAAYNAGENAVKREGNRIPPYPETKNYVRKVLALYSEYRRGGTY